MAQGLEDTPQGLIKSPVVPPAGLFTTASLLAHFRKSELKLMQSNTQLLQYI